MNKAPPSASTGHKQHTHAFGVVTAARSTSLKSDRFGSLRFKPPRRFFFGWRGPGCCFFWRPMCFFLDIGWRIHTSKFVVSLSLMVFHFWYDFLGGCPVIPSSWVSGLCKSIRKWVVSTCLCCPCFAVRHCPRHPTSCTCLVFGGRCERNPPKSRVSGDVSGFKYLRTRCLYVQDWVVWVATSLQMTESEDKQIAEAKIAELEKCMLQIGESSLTGFSGLNFNRWKFPF